ncbi:kynurenine formamidase [Podospora conica]|nr:kynurenine formamidase [Schizothecium conicum]
MTSQDLTLWSSIPWTPVHAPSSPTQTIGYHKPLIPYLPAAHPLQTLDVWIPPPPSSSPPPPSHIPTALPSLAFIHGGAWRDPSQTATVCFAPAAAHLLASTTTVPKRCYVSLSYRLSPSASRPDNTARHPDHIADVLAALGFLRRLGVTPDILVGHSCGATLAVQAVVEAEGRWGVAGERVTGVRTVVGVNGLWDLEGFICGGQGGAEWDGLRGGYEEFVRGAFGGGREVWRGVSPGSWGPGWGAEWEGGEGRRVWLVRSRGDELVPGEQGEVMREAVEREGVRVGGWEVEGGHDEVWERGEVLGGVVERVLRGET